MKLTSVPSIETGAQRILAANAADQSVSGQEPLPTGVNKSHPDCAASQWLISEYSSIVNLSATIPKRDVADQGDHHDEYQQAIGTGNTWKNSGN